MVLSGALLFKRVISTIEAAESHVTTSTSSQVSHHVTRYKTIDDSVSLLMLISNMYHLFGTKLQLIANVIM